MALGLCLPNHGTISDNTLIVSYWNWKWYWRAYVSRPCMKWYIATFLVTNQSDEVQGFMYYGTRCWWQVFLTRGSKFKDAESLSCSWGSGCMCVDVPSVRGVFLYVVGPPVLPNVLWRESLHDSTSAAWPLKQQNNVILLLSVSKQKFACRM